MGSRLAFGVAAAVLALAAASCGRTGVDDEIAANAGGNGGTGGDGIGGSGTTSTTSSTTTTTASTTTTTTTTTTGDCGGSGGPCAQCLSDQCPDLWCACYEDAQCTGLLQCLQGCGGPACKQGCLSNFPGGIATATLLGDCSATLCDGTCPGGQKLDDCQKCRWTQCGDETATCLANPECNALVQCVKDCGPQNPPCLDQCAADHPDGLLDLSKVTSCTQAECAAECP